LVDNFDIKFVVFSHSYIHTLYCASNTAELLLFPYQEQPKSFSAAFKWSKSLSEDLKKEGFFFL